LTIDILSHPICFTFPARLSGASAWQQHIPFAMYLIDIQRPKRFVELGTHNGDSYCAFCQAVKELNLETPCSAIDTWKGDLQTGYYGPEVLQNLRLHHDRLYGSFSRLMQCTFNDALPHFSPGSIDLLHIDGYHTFESVKHDFEMWLPMMSERGVILMHDIAERNGDYGVWRLWEDIRVSYPHFEFLHSHGLGVLAVGTQQPSGIESLCNCSGTEAETIRNIFERLGHFLTSQAELKRAQIDMECLRSELNQLRLATPKSKILRLVRWIHSVTGIENKKGASFLGEHIIKGGRPDQPGQRPCPIKNNRFVERTQDTKLPL
jgi:O-antigen biosynthesis protein